METAEDLRPVGYLELLRSNRDFRNLWAGNLVSLTGDWFNTIALYTLTEQLTGSPLAMGLIFMLKMGALAVASPIAGIVVDRFDRRRLMIGTDLIRAVLVLGFLLVDSVQWLPVMYVLIFAQLAVGAFFVPAKRASVPNIVSGRALLTANAISAATWSGMLAIGAALGGVAASALGTDAVFIIDASTYLVSAAFIWRIRIPQTYEELSPERANRSLVGLVIADIGAGWRYLIEHVSIGWLALAKMAWAAAGGGLVFMLTQLGREISPTDVSLGIGVLYSARGIGTGIGPIAARAWLRDRDTWPRVLGWCVSLSGLAYLGIAYLPWNYSLAIAVCVAHSFSGANWVLSTVLLQERSDDVFRGRVFATEFLLLAGVETLSILLASALLEAQVLSLQAAVLGFGGAMVVIGLAWVWLVAPRAQVG